MLNNLRSARRNLVRSAVTMGLLTMVSTCTTTREFQALTRQLPPGEEIVPSPALCRKAKASDDARVVALAMSRCARENQGRLVTGRRNYEEGVRKPYSSGAI